MNATIAPGLLTVEEVAAASGRSVQTVRRMCAAGTIPAVKSGRQWLIPADQLPPLRTRQAVRRAEGIDFSHALDQLRTTDFRQPWVPDVVNFEDHLASHETIESEAASRVSARGPFDQPVEVEVPKTPAFARTAHVLSIEDQVAYQAVVASVAHRIDRLLPDTVYSARLSKNAKDFVLDSRAQWLAWMEELSRTIRSGQRWMIKTDLTAYFDTIHHKRLSEDLRTINASSDAIAALERMLSEWSQSRGYGLPQGPNASRILANLYLAPIDHVMVDGDCHYSRWVDDIRIIGSSRPQVLRALRRLHRECKRRGLILSESKTETLEGEDALADCTDHELDAAQYWWQVSQYARARQLLRRIWDHALTNKGRLNQRHARFALYRLGSLRDDRPVHRILHRLEYLGPVAREVATYLGPWLGRPNVAIGLGEYLADPDRNTSPFLSSWLMAAIIDRPQVPTDAVARYARRVARDRNEPVYHRALALNLVARSKQVVDLDLLRKTIADEHDPALLRATLVALARAGVLDKGLSRVATRKAPVLERTVKYLNGRANLPALLTPGKRTPVAA
jgi:excisionase family DNA binding protein